MVDPENQNLDPDQTPEKFKPGGGEAIKAKNKPSAIDNVKDTASNKLAKVAGEATGDAVGSALVASGVGAWLAGVGRWVTKKATEAAAKWGLKDGNWLKVALAPVLSLILMFGIGAVAIAGIVKANRGGFGNEAPSPISMTNPEDRSDLNELMRLSGDYSAEDATTILKLLDKIADKIAEGELTFTDKDNTLRAMEKIRLLCETVIAGKITKTTKSELKGAISEFFEFYSGDNPTPFQGRFSSPVGDHTITGFNGDLHGHSFAYTPFYERHNVFKGFSSPGVGDATDIKIGSDWDV